MNEEERVKYFQSIIKNDEICMLYRNMKNLFASAKKEIKKKKKKNEMQYVRYKK